MATFFYDGQIRNQGFEAIHCEKLSTYKNVFRNKLLAVSWIFEYSVRGRSSNNSVELNILWTEDVKTWSDLRIKVSSS